MSRPVLGLAVRSPACAGSSPTRPAAPPCCAPRLAILSAIIALLAVGCDSPAYPPPTLIDQLRVLAVRAEPPYLGIAPSRLDLLAVGSEAPLCIAWQLCLFAWAEGGAFGCLDPAIASDLGTGATAEVSVLDLLPLLPKVPEVLRRKGLAPPAELNVGGDGGGGGTDAGEPPTGDAGLQVQILFVVAEAAVTGGVCPSASAALARPCADRTRCIQGYKALTLGVDGQGAPDPRHVHANPVLLGLRVGPDAVPARVETDAGADWPAAAPLRLAPYRQAGDSLAAVRADTHGLRLTPRWTPESSEVMRPSVDPGLPDRREALIFDWYSTSGTFDYRRSGEQAASNGLMTAAQAQAGEALTLWLVVRDERGGAAWLQRRGVIEPLAAGCVAALPGAATCVGGS